MTKDERIKRAAELNHINSVLFEKLVTLDKGSEEYEELRYKIYELNKPLANKKMRPFMTRGHYDNEDIRNTAYEYLWRSIDHFDPSKGYTFGTFAGDCITRGICRSLGFFNTPSSKKKVRFLKSVVSYDKPIKDKSGDDTGKTLKDIIPNYDSYKDFRRQQMRDYLIECFKVLTPSQREVFELLLSEDKITQKVIAKRLGKSPQCVQEQISKGHKRMRNYIVSNEKLRESYAPTLGE